MKYCPDCENDKPNEEFGHNRTRTDGLQTVCKECKSLRNRKSASNRTKRVWSERKEQRRKEIYDWLESHGIELVCDTCGEDHPATIDFHHPEPNEKDFSISVAIRKGYSLKRIIAEIEKCRIVCSNCHRKWHWEDRNIKSIGTFVVHDGS